MGKAMKLLILDILKNLKTSNHGFIPSTPQYIWNLVQYHLSSTLKIKLLYNSLMTGYQWIRSVLKSGSDGIDTLDIVNIAVLFHHSEDITFLMRGDTTLSAMECKILLQDMASISKMALTVNIHFVWSSVMPQLTRMYLEKAFITTLDDQKCYEHIFEQNAVSFIFKNISSDSESQSAFQNRVDAMISKLSNTGKRCKSGKLKISENLENQEDASDHGSRERFSLILEALSQSDLGGLLPPNIREFLVQYLWSQ